MNPYEQCMKYVTDELEKARPNLPSWTILVDDLDCIPTLVGNWELSEVRTSVTKLNVKGYELVAEYDRVR